MSKSKYIFVPIALAALTLPGLSQDQQPMSFFVTSVGSGDGGNLGGLAGADAHCQALASAVGRGAATWRAYLSQAPGGGMSLVNARDRIGNGPWYNANGVYVAWDVDGLHEDRNNMRKPNSVDENGDVVNGAGDRPNRHDILTGSKADGTGYNPWEKDKGDHSCSSWTSNDKGSANVGHHDRHGGGFTSWNNAHPSRGCSQKNLASSGGAGLLYCFAAD